MSQTTASSPLPYSATYETPEKDEAQTQEELIKTMTRIQEKTYADGGHAIRSVHAKSHAIVTGQLEVLGNLPLELAQGLFATPGTYPLVARFSTNPGDILDDNVSTPRGLALKIIGVPGPRLPGSEAATTQDFVLVNGPAFLKKDGKSFLSSLKLLAATTDRGPELKKALSAVLRGAEALIEKAGGQSPTLVNLGGQPEIHPLGETFYSAAPLLFGQYMAKISLVPVAPQLTALTKKPVDLKDRPDGLREELTRFFASQGGEWELRAQLCTDLEKMPIEDASVLWPEKLSPYRTVARLSIAPQPGWNEQRSRAVDDGLSFSPWHGLAAHRPLGSINRLRKRAYEMSAGFRASHNGVVIKEPQSAQVVAE